MYFFLANKAVRYVFSKMARNTHYSCILFLHDYNLCRPFSIKIYIKRSVRVLQIVRCTPIVFKASLASGPVVLANVFCWLINLQKKASTAFGV